MRVLLVTSAAAALLLAGTAVSQGQEPVAAPRRPAVLFVGSGRAACGYDVAVRLDKGGFALGTVGKELDQEALTWDDVRPYNALVVFDLGRCNADMSLPAWTQETLATVRRFVAAGGGVLLVPRFGQMATEAPAQEAFLRPLGLTPLSSEMPVDPGTEVVATAWRLPFSLAEGVATSLVAAGVSGLWYPTPHSRVGAQNHTIPCLTDDSWQVVVRGSRSSLTRAGALQAEAPTDPGSFGSGVPLCALKQSGPGRLAYLGITQEYLFGANALTTLEGIVLERGLRERPSDGLKLVQNALRWVCEPSLEGTELGGAQTSPALLQDPRQTRFGQPYDWPERVQFPGVEPALPGVIGARGAATPPAERRSRSGSRRPRARGSRSSCSWRTLARYLRMSSGTSSVTVPRPPTRRSRPFRASPSTMRSAITTSTSAPPSRTRRRTSCPVMAGRSSPAIWAWASRTATSRGSWR